MRRRAGSILAAASLLIAGVAAAPVAGAQPNDRDGGDALSVWRAQVSSEQVPLLLKAGADARELTEQVPAKGSATVELVLTDRQAGQLRGEGVTLAEHRLSAQAEKRVAAAGDGVFRPYGGPHGLKQEILDTARANPGLTKVVSIGKTLKGQDILALKLTKGARRTEDGSKPATLYMSNQHAREWITPEMTRRLLHYYLDGYGKDERITRIVDSTELWFVLSANPDGYDYTHADPAHRQWRKNLRDNDGDGRITAGDGVDLNRNFAYKWGYDNEGSSPDPADETFRGKGPMSEPETKALDAFQKRVGFAYGVNYHSAAQLLLYGVGWQIATDTPDDVALKALAGTPRNSAVPGYRPQVSSELYITNGEADGHAANVNGMQMFTPEMSTCATASRVDPDDAWDPADCASVFTFPDDEKLIQAEFAKNIPFALAVAETSAHPDRPVSPVGIDAPDFTPKTFATSYARGEDQEVAVTARKSLRDKTLTYRINGGRAHSERLAAWRGGETYGGEDNLYFDEYRAAVEGARPGDSVEVRFTARTREGRATSSVPFTYRVAQRPRGDVLVLAEEGGTTAARHTGAYVRALADNGRAAAVWDVATQGAPDALGVLSHFRTVVWYTGAEAPSGAAQLAVRAYLNEGGKLLDAGEKSGGLTRIGLAESDDFAQYYLGAYQRSGLKNPPAFAGAGALAGTRAALGAADGDPLDDAGAYTVTSDILKPKDFPRFASSAAAGDYPGVRTPFEPAEGTAFAALKHADGVWSRLARTVDLTGVPAASAPRLDFQVSYDTEPGYDNLVVEAHTVGLDDWTTLPDTRGGTSPEPPADCGEGFYVGAHPFLSHYLTVAGDSCAATGTTGSWNAFTGSSNGWRQASVDLSPWAGRKVELAVSYISDPGTGGTGVFVDDTRLFTGSAVESEGFETSLGAWNVQGPPAGSPGNGADWARSGALYHSQAAVTTDDTVLLGFGLEHVPAATERARLVGRALAVLRR
ncbi:MULTISPECIES: M14 family metallopeptidase [unclassified Streptomyces]|uniref:M14 family metallopeptidase n=1 Tax=unclassified Streptomyces TaxID=2593676 RepID=UPI0016612B03|nr:MULTISPECIES: M14 family metallopeptidase [unclassified Streptomyces]MBD0709207.1 zinc carboxypeptidase [Streptomyces sp. CBMA291]MBD0713538.1 zinc carboxypeptidase [Streptomyces sp. CBMA370]